MEDKRWSRDAISWLSEEVLGKILSSLPTEEAACTSVLAKKWRDVYRLVDNMDFDDSAMGEDKLERDVLPESFKGFLKFVDSEWAERYEQCNEPWYVFPDSFRNFVDRTLALQGDYPPIKKFSLKCHVGAENDSQKTCVRRWISNVIERGVVQLELGITDWGVHSLPPQLLASETLVKLTLGTHLSPGKFPSYASLPSLKTLFIDSVFFEQGDLCGVLLAGCPVLEELTIHHLNFAGAPPDISSSTVKRLSVDYDTNDMRDLSFDLPNLAYLDYSDYALPEYPLVNLESLVEAKLDLYPLEEDSPEDYNWSLVPDLTNLFFGIRNVHILDMSLVSVISRCVKHGLLVPVFINLVKLSFGSNDMNKRGWKLLAYLIKQSPNLETLIIQDLSGYTGDVSMPLNKVKMLHVLAYPKTAQASKQLNSFAVEFECLEMVQLDDVLHTKKDLKMLLGVSLATSKAAL